MPDDTNSPARPSPSKAPSWIMVGFVLGLLVFYTANDYFHRPKQPVPHASSPQSELTPATTTATATPAPETKPAPQPSNNLNLQALDIIFRKWAVNALWDYDTTQVLFYNPSDKKFSIPVEVTRRGVEGDYTYFYRPIDALTRPLVPAPDRPDTIIRFTENEETTRQREEKLREMWNTR